MDEVAIVASVLYQFGTNAAFLLLCALGLIVILGMMNIINLAHGELMMLGAYCATIVYQRGAPFWLSVICAFVVVGIFIAVVGVACAGVLGSALGIAAAYALYLRPVDIAAVRARLGLLYQAMLRKFYVDELYEQTIVLPGSLMADGMATFDSQGIDGVVNGLGRGTQRLAQIGRRAQTGFVRSYALAVLFGTLVISAIFLGGTLIGR